MVGSPPTIRIAGAVRVSRREAVRSFCAGERLGEGDVVRSAVVVDVVGAEDRAGELLEEVGLFVGEAVAADDADGLAAARVAAVRGASCRRGRARPPS